MIKTFVSYHHDNDQVYKNELVNWAVPNRLMTDMSVNTGDIDETLKSEAIRRKIRDDYLRDSKVTILLCGSETRYRKHVDWEIKSSMINGQINKRSGILVITLPTSGSLLSHTAFTEEKSVVYPDHTLGWSSLSPLNDLEQKHPAMPRRILENICNPNVRMSIVPWNRVYGFTDRFEFLLHNTAKAGLTNEYDLSRPMRRKNYNPKTDYHDIRV